MSGQYPASEKRVALARSAGVVARSGLLTGGAILLAGAAVGGTGGFGRVWEALLQLAVGAWEAAGRSEAGGGGVVEGFRRVVDGGSGIGAGVLIILLWCWAGAVVGDVLGAGFGWRWMKGAGGQELRRRVWRVGGEMWLLTVSRSAVVVGCGVVVAGALVWEGRLGAAEIAGRGANISGGDVSGWDVSGLNVSGGLGVNWALAGAWLGVVGAAIILVGVLDWLLTRAAIMSGLAVSRGELLSEQEVGRGGNEVGVSARGQDVRELHAAAVIVRAGGGSGGSGAGVEVAIALYYDWERGDGRAPVAGASARGAGVAALVRKGEAAGVMVVTIERGVAELLARLEVGSEVPGEAYEAVGAALAYARGST